MKIRAYAKVNLTLDVTGRREDGLHTLDTVMQSVSLWDEIELTPGGLPGIRVQCSRDYIPVDNGNTAYRAAQYFFRKTGLKDEGLSIVIHKRIPSRAGMGGGSTDTARTFPWKPCGSLPPGWGRTCPFASRGAPAAAQASGRYWSLLQSCRTAFL